MDNRSLERRLLAIVGRTIDAEMTGSIVSGETVSVRIDGDRVTIVTVPRIGAPRTFRVSVRMMTERAR